MIEFRGERGDLMEDKDAEDVEEAFEWVLLWKERIDETDEEVLFRPPNPRPDERRYEECGVWGCGDRDVRLGGGVDLGERATAILGPGRPNTSISAFPCLLLDSRPWERTSGRNA